MMERKLTDEMYKDIVKVCTTLGDTFSQIYDKYIYEIPLEFRDEVIEIMMKSSNVIHDLNDFRRIKKC